MIVSGFFALQKYSLCYNIILILKDAGCSMKALKHYSDKYIYKYKRNKYNYID